MIAKKNLLKTVPENRFNLFLVLLTMLLSVGVWGQSISMTATGTNTQNFNSLSTSGSTTWSDNSTLSAWYSSYAGNITANAGASTTAGLYSYGSGTNTDRALGSINTNASGNIGYGVQLQNNTGSTMTSMTVGYTGEQWRKDNNATADQILFYYRVYSTVQSNIDIATSGWTAVTSLNFTAPIAGATTAAILDGNAAANRIVISSVSIPSLSLPSGSYIVFKWVDQNISGTDHGIGIDDVTIAWTAASALTPPALTAAIGATVDNPFSVTFTDDAAWRSAITSITVGGTTLTAGSAVTAGNITFTPSASVPASLLQTDATRTIVVKATGYNDATVSQPISAGVATKLIINTQPVGPVTNGAALATQPQLYIGDQYNNPTSATSASVTAAVGAGSWTLGGITTVNSNASGNIIYSGLTATSASAVTGATIMFSAPGLASVTSSPFDIVGTVAPVITSSTTKSTVYGTADTYTITASGSPTGYSTGTLPTGFSFVGNVISKANTVSAGTYNISISASNSGGTDTKNLTWTVTAKNLTISGLSGVDKVYDRTTPTTLTGTAVLNTIVSGDDVTLSGTPVANFVDFNVGTRAITVTGYTLSGTTASNYTLSQPTGLSANITAKPLTLASAAASNKTYDTTTAAVISGNLTGIINPDVVTLSGTGTFASANAGTGIAVTSTSTLTGANAGNYTLTQPTGLTANITKATPVYTPTPISVTVGNTQTIASSISNSPGVLTFSSLNTTVASVGSTTGIVTGVSVGSTSVTVTQAEDTNYFGGSTAVSVTVTDIQEGTYRTLTSGTWPSSGTATWERLLSGSWISATPSSSTTDLLIIRHAITSNGSFAASGGNQIVVENGGKFTDNNASTLSLIQVKNGGEFVVGATGVTLAFGGKKIVESGGLLSVNVALTNASNFWVGTEDFQNGSTVDFANYSGTLLASTSQISNNTDGYLFGNLKFSGSTAITLVGTNSATNFNLTENDLILNGSGNNILIASAVSKNILINGNAIVNAGTLRGTTALSSITLNGNLEINGGTVNIGATSNGSIVFGMKLKGDLKVLNSSTLTTTDPDSELTFEGVGNGLTPDTTQNISISNTATVSNVQFKVYADSYVKLDTNIALASSSSFTVNSGGTLDFGFDSSFNPLNMTGNGTFVSQNGSNLRITSANGINKTGSLGNVQTTTRTYSNLATYHFVGALTPQSTGNAFENTGTATALNLVINKDNATDIVNLNTNTKTTGELNIIKGTFVETESNKIAGTTGKLTMSADATYKTAVTSNITPQLSGAYTLAAGSTIELNANTNQNFNATNTITYRNLIFSNGGTKTIGNTNENILGTVTIKDNTTVDASTNTFGGAGTNLTMSDTSKLILGSGTDPKPRMDGVYNLGSSSTIEFTGSSSTQIRVQTTSTNPIPYAKVIISGTNVKAGTTNATGLTFQSGGVFTVTGTGVYKVPNPAGFSGGTLTSIKNTNNPTINLETGSTVEYNGTTDQTITVETVAVPATGNYQNLAISGSGTKSPAANLTVNNMVRMTGATLKLLATAENAPANVLYAYKGIDNTNSAGTVIFENNAQLLQDADAVNYGNIQSQRLASNINNVTSQMDYIYWSSPVSGQDLKLFSPGTPTNRIYQYNEATDYFTGVNFATEPNFIPGKGYAFRAESTVTNGSSKTYSFTGTPNNGTIDININRSADSSTGVVHGYNLIGNPYPSNINFDELHLANSSLIWNTAYFWTNNSYTSTQMGSGYTPNNYAIYNGTGGNAATTAASGVGVTAVPNGIVKVGQSFIIQKKDFGNGILEFKNSYSPTNILRVPDNGTFFEKTGPKNRFWLEMTAPNNLVNSILVGYIPGATNDFETDYDGELFVVGSDSFYSVLGAKKLAIQGKSGNFSSEDVVALGHVYSVTGNYTIKLKNPEGIFDYSQNIYLRDKLLNKYVNLNSAGSYTFVGTKGTNDTRFEIVYKEDAVLGAGNESKSEFVVYRDGNDFVIKSSKSLGKVEVYDAAGRMITAQKTNEKILRLNVSTFAEGMFIIKAENSGDVKTKKILK